MRDVRCPECGYRLKSSECPICCTKVPFPVGAMQTERPQTRQYRPQRTPARPAVSFPKASSRRRSAGGVSGRLKRILFILILAFVVLPVISAVVGFLFFSMSEPDVYEESYTAYDEYQEAGTGDAATLSPMQPHILYEGDGLKVTADSIGIRLGSPAVAITVENNTDRDITVNSSVVFVNDYLLPMASFYRETEAGKTAQAYLTLDKENLTESGIDTVAEIVMGMHIYDSESYSDVAPYTVAHMKTQAYGLEQPVDDSGTLIWEEGKVRILFREAAVDEYGDAEVKFFVESMEDHTVFVGTEAVYFNGQEVGGLLWSELLPSTRAVDSIYVFNLADTGIEKTEDLKQIDLELSIQNGETWETVTKNVSIPINP